LAILLVFLYHYQLFPHPAWIPYVGNFGWIGVDLFFVLSGYLIADQLLAQRERTGSIALGSFYLRRAMRILPAYAAVLALYFLIPAVQERDGIAPIWKFCTFTMNWGLDLRDQASFSHAWSLCVEEHFYLLLPLTLLLFQAVRFRRAGWVLAALFLFTLAARGYAWASMVPDAMKGRPSYEWMEWIYYPTPCRLDGLLTGVGIAALMRYRPRWAERLKARGNLHFALGALCLLLAWGLAKDRYSLVSTLFVFTLVSIGFGLWVLAVLSPSFVLHAHAWKPSKFAAELAFTFYLVHKAVIHLTQTALSEYMAPESGLLFACCILTSVAAALALRMAVEKPFLKLRDRLQARSTSRVVQELAVTPVGGQHGPIRK